MLILTGWHHLVKHTHILHILRYFSSWVFTCIATLCIVLLHYVSERFARKMKQFLAVLLLVLTVYHKNEWKRFTMRKLVKKMIYGRLIICIISIYICFKVFSMLAWLGGFLSLCYPDIFFYCWIGMGTQILNQKYWVYFNPI